MNELQETIKVEMFNQDCEFFFNDNVPKDYVNRSIHFIQKLPDNLYNELCQKLINDLREYENDKSITKSNDEIIQEISGLSFYIYDLLSGKISFTMTGNCTWNEEHGFVVVVKNEKIVYFGEHTNNYYPYEFEDVSDNNYLMLGNTKFKLDYSNSSLDIHIVNNKISYCDLCLDFLEEEYNTIPVTPKIEIESIKLEKNNIKELIGTLFELNDVNESYEREDSFYLVESEPLKHYKITVIDINDNLVKIKMSGVGITDGYSEPNKTDKFYVEAIIKVIIKNDDVKVSNKKEIDTKKSDKTIKIIARVLGLICLFFACVLIEVNILLALAMAIVGFVSIALAEKKPKKK